VGLIVVTCGIVTLHLLLAHQGLLEYGAIQDAAQSHCCAFLALSGSCRCAWCACGC
jgi:hypothetical protein